MTVCPRQRFVKLARNLSPHGMFASLVEDSVRRAKGRLPTGASVRGKSMAPVVAIAGMVARFYGTTPSTRVQTNHSGVHSLEIDKGFYMLATPSDT